MDRLTLLENSIVSVLKDIDGSLQTTGYQYYTTTGQVDIDNDVLATSENVSATDINHTITTTPAEEENLEWGLAQSIYTNSVLYTITSQVKLNGDETNTKRSSKIKCNEITSDIKFALFKFHSLNKQCNWVKYNGSLPVFTTDGNLIKSAKVITTIELNYSQSMRNPDVLAC